MRDEWTIQHFSQSYPQGETQADVPALLRRVADSIAQLGDVRVQDVTFAVEIDDGEDWPAMTVYNHHPNEPLLEVLR